MHLGFNENIYTITATFLKEIKDKKTYTDTKHCKRARLILLTSITVEMSKFLISKKQVSVIKFLSKWLHLLYSLPKKSSMLEYKTVKISCFNINCNNHNHMIVFKT